MPREAWTGQTSRVALGAFLGSQFISLIGDRIATLAYVSLAASAAPEAAGAAAANVAAIQVAPVLLLSYLGGWLSDRLTRKWLMWWIDIARFTTVAAFVLLYEPRFRLYPVYGTVLALGALSALFNPAKRSFIPFLVGHAEIRWANWWMANSEVLAMLAGLAAGTVLLSVTSAQRALIADSVSFAAAVVMLLWVPAIHRQDFHRRQPALDDLAAGFRLVRGDSTVRGILVRLNLPFFLSAGLFYAAANHWAVAGAPANAGSELGRLLLALAAGALVSFFLRRRIEVLGERQATAASFFVGAVLIAALAATADVSRFAALALTFLVGITVGLLYVRTNYLLHLHAPAELVGRVISLREVVGAAGFAATVGLTSALGPAFTAGRGWLAAAAVFLLGGLAVRGLTMRGVVAPGTLEHALP